MTLLNFSDVILLGPMRTEYCIQVWVPGSAASRSRLIWHRTPSVAWWLSSLAAFTC